MKSCLGSQGVRHTPRVERDYSQRCRILGGEKSLKVFKEVHFGVYVFCLRGKEAWMPK